MIQWTKEYTDDFIHQHFENDVQLKKRMPHLIVEWHWAKNVCMPNDRAKGFTHIVTSTFKTREDLESYLTHPEHVAVKEIQASMVKDRLVMDYEIVNQ